MSTPIYQYHKTDSFYDYESLTNVATLTAYFPVLKKVYIGVITDLDHSDANGLTQLELDKSAVNTIIDRFLTENHDNIKKYGLTRQDIIVYPNDFNKIHALMMYSAAIGGTHFGFNSKNYDIKIMAYVLNEMGVDLTNLFNNKLPQKYDETLDPKQMYQWYRKQMDNHTPIYANALRQFSDDIIVRKLSPKDLFNYNNFQTWLTLNLSDHFIDISILNEHMRHTGLKRLSAQMGYKILASNKLSDGVDHLDNIDQLADLIAYNGSDSFNTMSLFEEKAYQNPFDMDTQMINRFGDHEFKNKNMKRDTTSAKYIENVISPNNKLIDDNIVSTAYPIHDGYVFNQPSVTMEQFNQVVFDTKKDSYHFYQALADFLTYNTLTTKSIDFETVKTDVLNADDDHNDKLHAKYSTIDKGNRNKYIEALQKYKKFINDLNSYDPYDLQAVDDFVNDSTKLSTADLTRLGSYYDTKNPTFMNFWLTKRPIIFDGINHRQDFFYDDGNKRLVLKDGRFQFDLLEYLKHTYQFDDKVYRYYAHYRGQDLSIQDNKTTVQNQIKNDPELGTKFTKGVTTLLPYDCPVAIKMSVGGAHGTIIDLVKYRADKTVADTFNTQLNAVKNFYLNLAEGDIDAAALLARKTKRDGFKNGEPVELQKSNPFKFTNGTYSKATFKKDKRVKSIDKYVVTLDTKNVIHIDISSYYPTLLTILKIFQVVQPDGSVRDVYGELKDERLKMKALIPHTDPSEWSDDVIRYNAIQLINKLLLNSASGAADATFDNNIRVNNKIYRMRLSGQLIIMALALELAKVGAIPNSVNTDGIYASHISLDHAQAIIDKWAYTFDLDADGEVFPHFISKDANNRLEADGQTVYNARGGTIGHANGPSLTSNNNKPTIADHALVKYFTNHVDMDNPDLSKRISPLQEFDRNEVKQYMQDVIDDAHQNKAHVKQALLHFQDIAVSSPNKSRWLITQDKNGRWIYNQGTNRLFIVDPDKLAETNLLDDDLPQANLTHLRLLVANKQVKGVDPEAANLVKRLFPVNANEIGLDETDSDFHTNGVGVGFMAFANHSQIDNYLMVNQNLETVTVDLLDVLDLDRYVDIAQTLWATWSESYVADYISDDVKHAKAPLLAIKQRIEAAEG